MRDRFVERLNRLPRAGRIVLCGAVVLMTMPILSSLQSVALLMVLGVGLYAVGWFFWVGFGAELPQVSTGATLYLLLGVAALLLWALYYLAFFVFG